MKFKIDIQTAIGFVVLVLMIVGIIAFQTEKKALKRQIAELEVRLAKSTEKVDTFVIRDSIKVAVTKVVEVDKTDYKAQIADKQLIKDLKLRIKEIESENQTLINTRDTVILNPLNDSVLTYSDKWCRFSFELATRVLDWEVRDSLTTFVSSEYRHHFLWWRWGKKGYKVTLVNHNPRSRIVYDKYIKMK